MKCSFQVGQKVVAIETSRGLPAGVVLLEKPIAPKVGKIYTVRKVLIGVVMDSPCVSLMEIPDQIIPVTINGELRMGSVVFEASGFRPIVTRKTDISQFQAMLNPSKTQVPA